MGTHFEYSASAAERWINCPGSVGLSEGIPDAPSGPDAMTGTAAHYLCERVVSSQADRLNDLIGGVVEMCDGEAYGAKYAETGAQAYGSDMDKIADRPDYHAEPITDEMIAGVRWYVDLIDALREKYPRCEVLTEHKTELIADKCGGTADCVILTENRIFVIDFKNGFKWVDPAENKQLIIYAAGVLRAHPAPWKIERVTLAIVQPNAGGEIVKTWVATPEEIREHATQIGGAIDTCEAVKTDLDNPAHFKPGSHCRYCKASTRCTVARAAVVTLARVDLPELPTEPAAPLAVRDLTPDQIAWTLTNATLIKDWIKNVEEQAERLALGGVAIPGYKLVSATTQRHVPDPDRLIADAKANGWEVTRETLRPLAALEKAIPAERLGEYVDKPIGAPTLAKITDKRPALPALNKLADLPAIDEV